MSSILGRVANGVKKTFVVLYTSTLAKNSIFDPTGTSLSSTNAEDAIKEIDGKVLRVGVVEVSVGNISINETQNNWWFKRLAVSDLTNDIPANAIIINVEGKTSSFYANVDYRVLYENGVYHVLLTSNQSMTTTSSLKAYIHYLY